MTTGKRSTGRDGLFFDAIAAGASISLAASTAGYARRSAYNWRKTDESFATRWEEAVDTAIERLEDEADRRAVEGTLRPVFFQGEQCGAVREYSDLLLIFRLKALRPEKYREHVKVEQRVTGVQSHGVLKVPERESAEVWSARLTALHAVKSENQKLENAQ